MQSLSFIREARALIQRIQAAGNVVDNDIQRDVNQLLTGLQNPSLMAAEDLVSEALSAGYAVRPEVVKRLKEQEERMRADGYPY